MGEQTVKDRKRKAHVQKFTPPKEKSMRRDKRSENEDDLDTDVDAVGIEEDDRSVSPEETDNFEMMRKISDSLIKWATNMSKSKRITGTQLADFKEKMETMKELLYRVEKEHTFMSGRLAEKLKIEKIIQKTAGGATAGEATTFAEAVKKPMAPRVPKITGVTRVAAPKVIFVKSDQDKQDLEEVKNMIKTSIRPSQLGVNIRRVIKTARGIMIEAEGEAQLDRIKTCAQLADKGLVFEQPKKRSPRLMIYDVDVPDQKEEMTEDIYQQNIAQSEIDIDTFKKEFRYVHAYAKKDQTDKRQTIVAECSARVRNLLRARDKLYIG